MSLLSKLFGRKKSPEEKREKELYKTIQTLKIDGLKALKTGQIDAAKAFYKKILELKKDDLDGLIYLSKIAIRDNDLENAAFYLEKVIELLPKSIDIKINLMSIYHLLHKDDRILELSKEVLLIDDKNTAAYYYQGIAYQESKDLFNAIAALTKCLTIESYHIDALFLRAKILFQMHQIDNALEDINKILERDKGNEDASLLKAQIFEAKGDFDEAYSLLKKIVEINPFCITAYHKAANIFINKKELDKALEILDETIELNPDIAESYHLRGKTRFILGDKEGALADYEELIKLDPSKKSDITGEFKN